MNRKQDVLDQRDNVDLEQSDNAINETVAEGRLSAVHWQDFVTDTNTLTHLKNTGRGVIKINLGYLPPDEVVIPFESYLRALIQAYYHEHIKEDDFFDQLEDHIKLIRNADMKHNTCLVYDDSIYQNYKATFAPFGYAVKERLTNFLGYIPPLEYSLIAEMWLRDIISDQTYKLPAKMTSDDVRAITLIKYREVLLSAGKTEADKSPLLPNMMDILDF